MTSSCVQGELGYALIEKLHTAQGVILNDTLENYLIPTSIDIPPDECWTCGDSGAARSVRSQGNRRSNPHTDRAGDCQCGGHIARPSAAHPRSGARAHSKREPMSLDVRRMNIRHAHARVLEAQSCHPARTRHFSPDKDHRPKASLVRTRDSALADLASNHFNHR